MYPNPANQYVRIDLSQVTDQEAMVQLINQLGQVEQSIKVKDANTNLELNTQGFTNGTYTVRIINNQNTLVTQRLVILHK
jgi:Secretion system C-terminal sorting domain